MRQTYNVGIFISYKQRMMRTSPEICFVAKFKSECHGKNMGGCNMFNKHPNNISFKVAQMSEHHLQ